MINFESESSRVYDISSDEEECHNNCNGQYCTLNDQVNYYKSIIEMNGLSINNERKEILEYIINNDMNQKIKSKILDLLLNEKDMEKSPHTENVYRLSAVLKR